MHVAFGRVRRKSRIGADDADDADYRFLGWHVPFIEWPVFLKDVNFYNIYFNTSI